MYANNLLGTHVEMRSLEVGPHLPAACVCSGFWQSLHETSAWLYVFAGQDRTLIRGAE